ncbi:lipoate--protein ligase family protein [Nakamurella sp. GG22]
MSAGEGLSSAAADAAIGPALLRKVAGGSEGWLRLYRPVPTVGFSRRDERTPGFPVAAAVARSHGFQPAVRSPGGRAAAYHRSCLCFDLVLPDYGEYAPAQHMSALGELLAGVLRDGGVDARVGEVEGEYCPGRFSVNAGGVGKVVGTAGRRVRGGLLLGGSIVVTDAEPLRLVLTDVYPALGLSFDPRTVVSAADFGLTAGVPEVQDALIAAFAPVTELSFVPLPDPVQYEKPPAVTAVDQHS